MRKKLLCLATLLFSLNSYANTQEYTLDNGLKLVVKEDHRAPVVTSMVWYKVGSVNEVPGITGIAHVLEHMMFKGTEKFGPGEGSRLVGEYGGQENAFTSTDYTGYYQNFSADNLSISLMLEADRMRGAVLDEEEFIKEIEVVKEERRMRTEDNPWSLTYENFIALAFPETPYSRPIVGYQHDLDHMSITDVRTFYNQWYAPNNATVVVVGDVNADEVYDMVKHYFGNIAAVDVPVINWPPESPVLGERYLKLELPLVTVPWMIMAFNTPVVNSAQEAWEPYALTVLSGILSGGNSARLQKDLVREQQVASAVSASYDTFSLLPNALMIDATPRDNVSLQQLQQAILTEIKKIQQNLVSNSELNKVKTQIVANDVYAKDSVHGQGIEIGTLESVGLGWQVGEAFIDNIKAVTAEQVQAVAKKYLIAQRMTVAEMYPVQDAEITIQGLEEEGEESNA